MTGSHHGWRKLHLPYQPAASNLTLTRDYTVGGLPLSELNTWSYCSDSRYVRFRTISPCLSLQNISLNCLWLYRDTALCISQCEHFVQQNLIMHISGTFWEKLLVILDAGTFVDSSWCFAFVFKKWEPLPTARFVCHFISLVRIYITYRLGYLAALLSSCYVVQIYIYIYIDQSVKIVFLSVVISVVGSRFIV